MSNRNILISFLGVGPLENEKNTSIREYRKAKYRIDGEIFESSFLSEVLSKKKKYDKIFILGTVKSMWEEYYRVLTQMNDTDDLYFELTDTAEKANRNTVPNLNLYKKLESKLINTKILIMKYGITREELLENISILTSIEDDLSKGDKIDIDVTHSFRSIPMLSTVFISYLKDVSNKELKIGNVFYGMFEIKSENDNIAEVVDLSPITEVMEWTKAAYSFNEFGNGYLISEFLQKEDEYLSKNIRELTDSLQINFVQKVKSIITRGVKYTKLSKISSLIVPKVIEEFKGHFKTYTDSTSKKDSILLILLSEYYYIKKIYSSSYIVLDEAIVKYVMEQEEKQGNQKDEDFHRECKIKIFKEDKYRTIRSQFDTLNKIRNNIGHSLNLNETERAIKELPEYIKYFKHIILSNSK